MAETAEAGPRVEPFAVLSFPARIAEVYQRRLAAALESCVAAVAANRARIDGARPLAPAQAWSEAVSY